MHDILDLPVKNIMSNVSRFSANHFFGLDIIRLLAALLVVMLHFGTAVLDPNSFFNAFLGIQGGNSFRLETIPAIIFTGSLGVQIFFVIRIQSTQ